MGAGRAAQAAATEEAAVARLPGGRLDYVLRRSPRATRLRVMVHPRRGVVVTVPSGRGWARATGPVEDFLRDRESWIRGHLGRQDAVRERLETRPALGDGREVPYLGVPHRVRLASPPPGARGSRVVRRRDEQDGRDELVVEQAARDARPVETILEAWFRVRAREAIEAAVRHHADALGVTPSRITIRDTTSRWGSCSRRGALSFSWRLVLAPAEALDAVAAHEVCHLLVFGHGPRFLALLDSRVPDHVLWRRWLRRHSAELHAALD